MELKELVKNYLFLEKGEGLLFLVLNDLNFRRTVQFSNMVVHLGLWREHDNFEIECLLEEIKEEILDA